MDAKDNKALFCFITGNSQIIMGLSNTVSNGLRQQGLANEYLYSSVILEMQAGPFRLLNYYPRPLQLSKWVYNN